MHSPRRRGLLALLALPAALLLCTCDTPGDPNAPETPAETCYSAPTTHLEIINSCGDGISYDKPAQLPKFAPGAPLMPLP